MPARLPHATAFLLPSAALLPPPDLLRTMNQGPGSLNRIYRLVWNESTGGYVAVAESARGRGKRGTVVAGALAAALAALAPAALAAGPGAQALPQGGQVVSGQAALQESGSRLDITQGSPRAAINWQQFNIGSAAQVHIQQPDASSVLLNRVVGADPSALHGVLSANGQVLLVNPNGIVFGKNARVDVGGLVASTLELADADFEAGRYQFQRGTQGGAVLNQGELRAADGGYLALLAPEAVNEGLLAARLGTVALAAGDAVTLTIDGRDLLAVKVDAATVDALVANRHLVQAQDGQVILSAGAARRLRGQAVAGEAGADALVADGDTLRLVAAGGRIEAGAGQVHISGGTVDAEGVVQAGAIALQADHLNQSGRLDASQAAKGGRIHIDAGTVVQTASAELRADGARAGGSIRVDGGDTLYSSATVSAVAADGQGGDIALTADQLQLRAATVDASGAAGGGRVRVGGGFLGQDRDLPNAQNVGINGSTVLRADAQARGDGGEVVVWSDGATVYGGRLSARGGSESGHGGRAEVSGKVDLRFAGQADLGAPQGRAGQLLLDPRNIIIDEAGHSVATLDLSDPTPTVNNGFGTFTRVLDNGNVIISAPRSDTGGQVGTGAVYLFDSKTGALLSNLRGAQAGDEIGSNGVRVLGNGHYLVLSPKFNTVTGVNTFNFSGNYGLNQNATASAGAITWQSGGGGTSGTVGSGNSLLGSTANTDSANRYTFSGNEAITNHGAVTVTANDQLGSSATRIVELADGHVVFATPHWNNGRGAVAWMDAGTGQLADGSAGASLSAATALVGSTPIRSLATVVSDPDAASRRVYVTGHSSAPFVNTNNSVSTRPAPPGAAGDAVGEALTALPNGGYVVLSPLWTNGAALYAGAVTWGAPGGSTGAVATGNSLVGSRSYDYVGRNGLQIVGDGNYLVSSPLWSAADNPARGRFLKNNPNGAVTWVDGSTGRVFGSAGAGAAVGSNNSLTGHAGQLMGSLNGGSTSTVTASYNYVGPGNYSEQTSSRTVVASSGANVRLLQNGNYLVVSNVWNSNRGSVSFGRADTGTAGVVSAANSLVGASSGDSQSMSIVELADSHYAVVMPFADLGATDGGAVTWASGDSGEVGVISQARSLYGTQHSARVGSGGVLPVGTLGGDGLRSNYIVLSPQWGNRSSGTSTVSYGAVTWVDGSTGRPSGAAGQGAAVGAANSLVGSHAGDYVGSYHYANYRNPGNSNNSGFTVVGLWDARLNGTVDVLANGDYVVRSPSWDGGKGAVTWAGGDSGIAGTVSAANSLVGSVADQVVVTTSTETRAGISVTDSRHELRTTGDHIGLSGQALSNGNYLVVSPYWDNGRGAITLVGSGSPTGAVGAGNSVVGSTGDSFTDAHRVQLDAPGDRLGLARSTQWGTPTVSEASGGRSTTTWLPIGPYTTSSTYQVYTNYYYNPSSTFVGYNNSVGSTVTPVVRELANGNVLVASPGWNDGAEAGVGAVTWINGSTGELADGSTGGVLSADNSLVGSHAGDLLGNNLRNTSGFAAVGADNFLLINTQWHGQRGAVTWGSGSAGVSGVVSAANSLVGEAENERVGSGGVTPLADGNAVVLSPFWGLASANYNMYGAPMSRGAATWVDGQTGLLHSGASGGAASAANSLVGAQPGDALGHGANPTVLALAGGHYAVASPYWSNGAATAVGAVTFAPQGGLVGVVSADNSLTGSTAGDRVGNRLNKLETATGTHYLVASINWTNPYNQGTGLPGASAGALTWVDGGTGRAYGETDAAATVSARNSLVGEVANGRFGQSITLLGGANPTGDVLVVNNPGYTPGAYNTVSLIPGATGLAGPVSWRNSVVGVSPYGAYNSIQHALLPADVTDAEAMAARVLLWVTPSPWMNSNGTRAVAATVLADNAAVSNGVDQVNGRDGNANWVGSHLAQGGNGFAAVGGVNGLLGFSTLAGDDVVITPATLTALLNAGTDVTLQASRDIMVLRDIVASANGQGGSLTLEAGGSVHLRANIHTDNGDFTALANQSVASGVVDDGCTTCTAIISQAPGTAITTGSGQLTLSLLDSSDKAGNAAGAMVLAGLSGEQIFVSNAGADAMGRGVGLRFVPGAVVGGSHTDHLELLAQGRSTDGIGGLVLAGDTLLNGQGLLHVAAARDDLGMDMGLNGSAGFVLSTNEVAALFSQGTGFSHYQFGSPAQTGQTTVGALDFSSAGLRAGAPAALAADVTLAGGSGGLEVTSLLKSDAAAGHALKLQTQGGSLVLGAGSAVVAASGSLQLNATGGGSVVQQAGATLDAAQLALRGDGDITLQAGSNRVAVLQGQAGSLQLRTTDSVGVGAPGLALERGLTLHAAGAGSDITLDGVVHTADGDLVLAAGRHFLNNNATDTGLAADQGRYLVYASDPSATTEGMTGYHKRYAQGYAAGHAPAYAAAGNWFLYSVTPTITVSVAGGGSTVYGAEGTALTLLYSGLIDGDSAGQALQGQAAGTFDDVLRSSAGHIAAGTYSLSLSGLGSLSSQLGYAIQVTPGSASLHVARKAVDLHDLQAADKVYDGSTAAGFDGTAALRAGGAGTQDRRVFDGDQVLVAGTATGQFDDRHAGTAKRVTLSGLSLAGSDAGNYQLVIGDQYTADITPKALNVQGLMVVDSKVYDGHTAAQVNGFAALGAAQAAGSGSAGDGLPYAGDVLALTGQASANYNAASVAGANRITIGGLGLAGAHAGNYTLATDGVAGSITPKALSLTGVTAQGKVYDGGTVAALAGTPALAGVVGHDDVGLAAALTGRFSDANAGTGKTVYVDGLALAGADAGNYTVNAHQTQADIERRAITVTAGDRSKVYGDAEPALDYVIGGLGLAGGDTRADVLQGAPSTVTGAAATAGQHPIGQGSLALVNGNYLLSFSAGTLTVSKATLQVSADDQAKTYGDAEPTLTYTVNAGQLKYGDGVDVVRGITLSAPQAAAATAGTHPITASGGAADNYVLVLADGQLTVAKATLQVSADNQTKTYGGADPTLSYTVNAGQLKYGDGAGVVRGITLHAPQGAAATAGTHTITAGGGAADNYVLVLADGQLTVAKATLQVSADDQAKTYGGADPTLSYTVNAGQLKYGDGAGVVRDITLHAPQGAAATAGTHTIAASGGDADNYVLVLADGTLSVAKAALTVVADNQSKVAGQADPVLTWQVDPAQLQHGDTLAVLDGVTISAPSGRSLVPGQYSIVLEGQADNYALQLVNGVYEVKPARQVDAEHLNTHRPAEMPVPADTGAPVAALVVQALPAGRTLDDIAPGTLGVLDGGVARPALTLPAAEGALVVLQPLTELVSPPGGSLRLETAASFSQAAGVALSYSAALANGEPLPAWLQFDAASGLLVGTLPQGLDELLELIVKARRADGQEEQARVRLRAVR